MERVRKREREGKHGSRRVEKGGRKTDRHGGWAPLGEVVARHRRKEQREPVDGHLRAAAGASGADGAALVATRDNEHLSFGNHATETEFGQATLPLKFGRVHWT